MLRLTLSSDSEVEYIACEVKKSTNEIDRLLELMSRFGKCLCVEASRNEQNAFRKLQALRSRRPPLFWAVGPAGLSHAFRVEYSGKGEVSFQEIEIQKLDYASAKSEHDNIA